MKNWQKILILLFSSTIAMSQTKQETETWINNNINQFPVSYGDNPNDPENRIVIEDGILYFYYHLENRKENYFSGIWNKINLNDIKNIEYSYNESVGLNNRWLQLNLNFDEGKCLQRQLNYPHESKNNNDYKLVPDRQWITMRLNGNFVKDGMKPRIEKALVHIIKLYGGKVSIKKEPF